MAVVVPLALWDDIAKMVHYLQKRYAAMHAVKVCFNLLLKESERAH
jgi:hypothetical protein